MQIGIRYAFETNWIDNFYSTDQNIDELRNQLRKGEGKLYCLDTIKLDSIYHDYSDLHSLHNAVEAHLEGLSKTITQLFMVHPAPENLCLILSGDHGQLLGYSSIINGIGSKEKSKGRALHEEPEYEQNIYKLSSERFANDKDYWIILSDENFGAKKEVGGKALGVHGGAFPEELLVACSVLQFNPSYKDLDISIKGSGTKKASGEVIIDIRNINDVEIANLTVCIQGLPEGCNRFNLRNLLPLSKITRSFEISDWPDSSEGTEIKAQGICEYQFVGDNEIRSQECEALLICQEMYKKDISLLDEF